MRNLRGDHIVTGGRQRRRASVFRDGEIRRLEAEVARLQREVEALSVYRLMAYNDDLTGLRNRRYFEERLREELSRSQRAALPCSVVSLDIDDFKLVNDAHGHAAGDQVLRAVGAMLHAHGRTVDIACRIGGDEFAIILPLTGREGALSAIARLEAAEPSVELPGGRPLRLSFGVATYPEDASTSEDLLARADRVMYDSKRSRKGEAPPGGTSMTLI